jgi:hypothetical protein
LLKAQPPQSFTLHSFNRLPHKHQLLPPRAPGPNPEPQTMAGPKYQNVPQRDSLDEPSPSYSQAPPSYQAEDPTQAALLGGVPRSEDDNVPDDFKFGGVVAEATLDIRMAFIRKVYAIL